MRQQVIQVEQYIDAVRLDEHLRSFASLSTVSIASR